MSDGIGSVSVTVVPDARGFPEKLRAQLAALLRDLKVNVRVDADTAAADAQFEETNLLIDRLDGRTANVKVDVDRSSIDEAESALSGVMSKLSGVGLAAGALGPGLIPLGAGLVGVLGALGGPLATATAGVGAFAGVLALMISQTEKAVKGGGPLTEWQKQLVALGHTLKSAFAGLEKQVAPAIMKPLTDGLALLVKLMPAFTPLIKSAATAIDGLVKGFSKFADTKGFKSLSSFFSAEAGKALTLFGEAIGNIALGIARFFKAMSPEGNKLLKSFADAMGNFAHSDFSGVVSTLTKDIPTMLRFMGDLFKIVADTVSTLAPYGEKVVGVVDAILKALDKVPAAAGAVGAALSVGAIGAFFGAPEAGLGAGAFVAAIAGIKALYDHVKPLQRIFHDIGDYFTGTWLPLIKKAADQIGPAFSAAFHDISKSVRENKGFLEEVGKALVALTSSAVIGGILAIAAGIRGFGKAFAYAVKQAHMWADIMLTALRVVVGGLRILTGAATAAFGKIIDAATHAFGWLPGIGPKLKAADAAFHAFAAQTANSLEAASQKLSELQGKIDAVGHSHPSFKVVAQTAEAIASLEHLQAMQIQNKSFTVTQIERTVGPGGGMGRTHADGGYITGPGGPRDDRIPAMLSNGEFVVNAAATAMYRPLLERLNARRFADGGFVGAGAGGSGAADAASKTLAAHLKQLTKAVDATSSAIDKERSKRQSLIQAETSLAQSVAASFRSDLFGQASSPWASMGSPDAILRGDIRNAAAFNKALHAAAKKGLDGGLFSSLASSGNLQAAQMFAHESRAQIAQTERLYRERQRLTAGIGQYVGDRLYAKKVDETNHELHRLNDKLHTLNAEVKTLRHEQAQHAHTIAKAAHDGPNKAASTAVRRSRR
jgi:hypothetical protein